MKIKVSDIADLNLSSIGKNKPTEIIYFDTKSITNGIVNRFNVQKIQHKFPSRAKRRVKHNTILYGTVRPIQKHYGILKNPHKNLIVSTGFITLDIKDDFLDKVDPHYLYYFLTRDKVVNHLQMIAKLNDSSYPAIYPDDLGNLEIKIPSFDYQKKISEFIMDIDKKISINKLIINALISKITTLYNYWFYQFEFPEYKTKQKKEMFFNSVLNREMPKDWQIIKLNEYLSFEKGIDGFSKIGYQFKNEQKDSIRYYKVRNLNSFEQIEMQSDTDFIDLKYWIKNNNTLNLAKPNDILISFDGTAGKMGFGLNGAFSGGIRKVVPKNGFFPKSYLLALLASNEVQQRIKNFTTGGNIKHASDAINDLSVAYNEDIVTMFDTETNNYFDIIIDKIIENRDLNSFKKWLIPNLIDNVIGI